MGFVLVSSLLFSADGGVLRFYASMLTTVYILLLGLLLYAVEHRRIQTLLAGVSLVNYASLVLHRLCQGCSISDSSDVDWIMTVSKNVLVF